MYSESEASSYHDEQCGEMAMSTLWGAHFNHTDLNMNLANTGFELRGDKY